MLGVHVLGPGFGETVIIELPDGEIGVIDSFAARHTGPPALEFLRVYHPKLTKLKFVALTHPHADHCMGMSRYFDQYAVEEFWHFHSFLLHACTGFFKAMHEKKTEDAVEKALDLPAGSVWLDALKLRRSLKDQAAPVHTRSLNAVRTFELCGGSVTAKFLTPTDASTWRYTSTLTDATNELLSDGPKLNPKWDPAGLPHNQASGSILFEYGQTRVLLMADAEDDLWTDLTNEHGDDPIPKVNFIKGAHHGSANGYQQKIYNCAADKNTVLVITPFNRHKYPLPTDAGVNRLLPHVKEVFCTNSEEARKASGLAWKYTTTKPAPSLPPDWAVDCRANPKLLSLLDDQQATHPYPGPSVALPRKWLHDCQKRQELLQLLCPALRNVKVTAQRPNLVDEFRVSMKYDNGGQVVDRYVGWGVGHLPGAQLRLDDPVLKFFPADTPPQPSDNLKVLTVRDLLTMSGGHDAEPRSPGGPSVKQFLATPFVHKPGTHFQYNSLGSYTLAAIVTRATGQTPLDYLKPRLFDPLGMDDPHWGTNAEGFTLAGGGLKVRTEDITKFGQLYIQKGEWHGKQLIPRDWVELATSRQVPNDRESRAKMGVDWRQGYGFQFGRCTRGAFRGDSAAGQFVVVIPDQDAVVAITADTGNMQGELDAIWEKLYPAFGSEALPADSVGQDELMQAVARLEAHPTKRAR